MKDSFKKTMPNLDFDGQNTSYATHGLHAYAAKCPPQLVRYGLHYYSKPGETVMDPMAGSGTTLVEAQLMGRNSIGYDIDPLAQLVAQVKSRSIPDETIGTAFDEVIKQTEVDLKIMQRLPSAATYILRRANPPDFPGRDYWFSKDVIIRLSLLSYHIAETDMTRRVRNFLWVAFSSLILAKTSVANARDIVHSRHHHWEHVETPDVIGRYKLRVKQMRKQMLEFTESCQPNVKVKAIARLGDARRIRQADESVDLIFTSPPYVTALDYSRAHFLAVAWMHRAFEITLPEYKERGMVYIGTERGVPPGEFMINDLLCDFTIAKLTLERLAQHYPKQAKLTQRYFLDMHRTFTQMHRVLRTDRHAILVVCPSHIRKVIVPTQSVYVEMCNSLGFRLKQQCTRTISKGKRILPYMQKAFGKRMSTEYVLVFQKL
jgi:hypothetical protein